MELNMKESVVILYNTLEGNRLQENEHYKDVEIIDEALKGLGYCVERIAVDKNISELISRLVNTSPRYIFNLCEEVENNSWGEIYVAGLLELLRIPYTGANPFCLALSLNKAKTKDVLRSQGILVPEYQVFDSDGETLREVLTFPLIMKPLCEDGSFGIEPGSVVYNKEALYERVSIKRKEFNGLVIVEEYIEGRELNISILGNGEGLTILPISEIDYSALPSDFPRICSYTAKWEKDSMEYKGTVPICPAHLSQKLQKKVEEVAVRVYQIMECTDYARVDIRLSKDEVPYVIDVNPNPCISPDSGFVRSAKAAGMDYKELIKAILTNCQERYHNGEKAGARRPLAI